MKRIISLAAAVMLAALASGARSESANAAVWTQVTGNPGKVSLPTIKATGGYFSSIGLEGRLIVYRSTTGSATPQRISARLNIWKWVPYVGWQHVRVDTRSVETAAGQHADFDLSSQSLPGSGFYAVTLNLDWTYTNGAQIGTAGLSYNGNDYRCTASFDLTCFARTGWVDLTVFP